MFNAVRRHSHPHTFAWLILFCAVVALVLLIVLLRRESAPPLSSDLIADCVWQTSCWHEDYYDAFVRDGLIRGLPSEGDLIGLISYRIEAISTQDLFTFFTIIFSVLIFLAGLQYGRLQDRRAHTLDVVMGIFQSDALATANVRLAEINLEVESGDRTLDGSVSGEDDAAIITLLDYYEFICQGVLEGSLSSRAVKEVRGGAMRTTYNACERYIADRRDSLSRPRLYWALERFVKNTIRDRDY